MCVCLYWDVDSVLQFFLKTTVFFASQNYQVKQQTSFAARIWLCIHMHACRLCCVDEKVSSQTAGGPFTPTARLVCSSLSHSQEKRRKQQEGEREEKRRKDRKQGDKADEKPRGKKTLREEQETMGEDGRTVRVYNGNLRDENGMTEMLHRDISLSLNF